MIFTNMKKLLFLAMLLTAGHLYGQLKYGIYGGFNFPGVSSGLSNVRDLPVDKGGFSFMAGVHANSEILKDIEIESGINLNSKGYTYETIDSWDIPHDNYNKISTISIPVTVMYYLVGKDDYGNRWEDFRVGAGVGLYAGYALSGTITDEDNNKTTATFLNTNRLDYGGRVMLKTLFGHFEGFIVGEFGLRNNIKDGSAILKQNSLMLGIGYQF